MICTHDWSESTLSRTCQTQCDAEIIHTGLIYFVLLGWITNTFHIYVVYLVISYMDNSAAILQSIESNNLELYERCNFVPSHKTTQQTTRLHSSSNVLYKIHRVLRYVVVRPGWTSKMIPKIELVLSWHLTKAMRLWLWWYYIKIICRGYPAKRTQPAMLTHGR